MKNSKHTNHISSNLFKIESFIQKLNDIRPQVFWRYFDNNHDSKWDEMIIDLVKKFKDNKLK